MATAMTASTFYGMTIPAKAAEPEWISDDQLKDNSTAEPKADDVLPSENQYNYQKEELAAFCHFGPNTFNEIEWGENYGDKTPNEIFKLTKDFDADTLVKSIKDAGFKKLIVTAKHHDGFCIWASDYTKYDVDAATNYPGDAETGRRDILEEISAACTGYDIDMGLYLSPWDIHDPSYGYYDENRNPVSADEDVLDYNDYYNNQLEEILGDDRYGNDGHFVEVWMDGAKGSGANAQEYDFERWFATIQKYEGKASGKYDSDCMLFGAQAYTTVRWIGNENGYADKNTWSKSTVNYEKNTIDSNSKGGYTIGYEDGNQWTVPEADARITSGWFWGTTKNTPKSITDLGSMYFGSVGNNATLLLNIPPNNEGTVDKAILDRVAEFGKNIKETFDDNLAVAESASVKADNVRGNDTAFKPGNTVDGDDKTYWTTEDGTNKGTLLVDLGGVKTFDVVSVEEAIQNGQRINEYKIEYRNASGEWNVMDSGETIGAKRLCRTGAVKGDQVRITVSTTEGKVPMISEVGVYKASDGFELTGAAPDGMDVIDISNTDSFQFSNGWTDESGPNFIGGTNKWANAGASFTLTFEGTKVYLLGTKDPNHGTADVYIDDQLVETIDTSASSRALGQLIFESGDLADDEHTLRLEVKNKAIGIESAYVINNGGKGMIGLETDNYTMNEDTRMDVKLVRVGGSEGAVSVQVAPNPGSAIQDDFNTELITTVTFAEGQTEATAPVETRRNTNTTGDREFSIELTALTEGVIVGFNDKATVTILDTESSSKEALQTLVDEGTAAEPEWYTAGWDAYTAAITAGAAVLEKQDATVDEITEAISAINAAKEGLTAREKYTEEDPFVLPWKQGSSSTLEAEFAELKDEPLASDGKWALQIADASWASNGKYVNCLNQQDTVSIPYYAEKAGTYTFTAYYRSGDPNNALSWSETGGKITAGTVSAGASDSAGATHEVSFDIVVTEAGAGTLIFTGPDKKSPQLDKFEIVPKEVALGQFTITAAAGENGTISDSGASTVTEGESKTYTITPNDGYKIADVKVNDESVGAVDTYTFENVSADATIEAVFEFANYTEANRFYFPADVNGSPVILEAEYSILNDVKLASDGQWGLQVADASWASNGKYVNCLNQQDTISIPYYAEKAGTYSFTAYYRSGDPNNALSWSEADGKITEGTSTAGANDGAGATHEVTFDVVVTQAGAGTLIFTGPDKKSPQLDKFDIVLKEETGAAEIDKSILESKIAEAKSEAEKTETYTEESIAALKNAISEAEKVFNDAAADQEAVDDQVKLLTNAINALVEIPVSEKHKVTVDSGTNGNVTVSGTDQEGYVEEGNEITVTVNANEGYVIDALTAADTSYTDAAGRSSYEFKMKVTADITIRATFKEESTEPVTPDKSALEAELKEAAEILAQTDKYTEESLAEYQKAVDAAKAVLNEEKATAEEIEAAVKALADAKTLLVEKNNDTPDPGTGDGEDKPGTGTDKPGTGSGSDKPSAGNDKPQSGKDSGKDTVKAVQTGDDTNIAIWVFALAAAAAAGGAVIIIRKRNMK